MTSYPKVCQLLRQLALPCVILSIPGGAAAQDRPAADEYKIGPVELRQDVGGRKITMPVNLYISLAAKPEGIFYQTRAFADLGDIQRQTNDLIKSVPLPKDNCDSYSSDNIVASISSASLKGNGDHAVLKVDGSAQVWQCIENITQDITIKWKVKKLCCGIKTKVPVQVRVSRSNPIKNKLLSQSFSASMAIKFDRSVPDAIGLTVDDVDINLNGPYAGLLRAGLFFGGYNLNSEMRKIVNKSLRANAIPLLVPEQFKIFSPTLRSIAFVNDGNLKISAVMAGSLAPGSVTDQINTMVNDQANVRRTQ